MHLNKILFLNVTIIYAFITDYRANFPICRKLYNSAQHRSEITATESPRRWVSLFDVTRSRRSSRLAKIIAVRGREHERILNDALRRVILSRSHFRGMPQYPFETRAFVARVAASPARFVNSTSVLRAKRWYVDGRRGPFSSSWRRDSSCRFIRSRGTGAASANPNRTARAACKRRNASGAQRR